MPSGPGSIIVSSYQESFPASADGQVDWVAVGKGRVVGGSSGPTTGNPTGGAGVAVPDNLLAVDRPTLVTEWAVESVSMPVAAYIDTDPVTSMTIGLALFKNGEPAFSASTGPLAPTNFGGTDYVNGQINADLVNPIYIGRGDRLKLLLNLTTIPETASAGYLLVGVKIIGVSGSAGLVTREGRIGYTVYEIAGTRRL